MARRIDFLTTREKTALINSFSDLVNDPEVNVSITYKSFTSKAAFNPQSGSVVSTYATSTINTFRLPLSEEEVFESQGRYQLGDFRYLIQISDIATPKKDDEILDGTKRRLVHEISTDPLNIFSEVIARNLKGE